MGSSLLYAKNYILVKASNSHEGEGEWLNAHSSSQMFKFKSSLLMKKVFCPGSLLH